MKKRHLFTCLLILLFILVGCSTSSNDANKSNNYDVINSAEENVQTSEDNFAEDGIDGSEEVDTTSNESFSQSERLIIHRAYLATKVKNLADAQLKVEQRTEEQGGYVVEANVYRENEENNSGYMTVRIPEERFQDFLAEIEAEVDEVIERSVSGQDITEDYVDLESRLKSKRVVEERLLAFMEEAEKTEDLLTISSDLATVQEEIEVLTGRINFLDNQIAYSTVDIAMYESGVKIPEVGNQDLDTWEKTKKQLATSVNYIFIAASNIFIFIVGSLPIILILLPIGAILYVIFKRKRPKE